MNIEQAVEQRRVWLLGQLDAAANRFDIAITGTAVNTYDMRSAGATAHSRRVGDVWLRVVVEDPDYQPACRWDGNLEANRIRGVPKPEVLHWTDWHNAGTYLRGRRIRAEVMTLAPGISLAPDAVLLDDPHLPESWWHQLHDALTTLAAHPTNPDHELGAIEYTTHGVHEHFGFTLDPDTFANLTWSTAHADLHWGNLRGPELCILDWESWRPAPAGYDLATLYCTSLLHSPTAQRIRAAPDLATPTGRFALLHAICRYLNAMGDGSDLDRLRPHLHSEARTILSHLQRKGVEGWQTAAHER